VKPKLTTRGGRESEIFSARKRRAFPVTDCNYQAYPLDRFRGGGSAKNDDASFLDISREYFRYEARRNFVAEGIFFLALVAILAATFISGALVIIRFLQLPEA
jgi:hypothetical protein